MDRLSIDSKFEIKPKKLNYFNEQFQNLNLERDIFPIESKNK